jgi:hypothetical protein
MLQKNQGLAHRPAVSQAQLGRRPCRHAAKQVPSKRHPTIFVGCEPRYVHRRKIGHSTSGLGLGRSLIPGLWSRLSKHILAGFMVLSAVRACPPHDSVG